MNTDLPTQATNAVIPRAYATPRERTVDGMNREEACRHFQKKILAISRKVWTHVRDDAGVAEEDLVSFGVLGLLEAFDRYQEGKGIEFGTFAEYRIRGAMLDTLRTMDTFTRRRRDAARRLKAAEDKARELVGRRPTATEVAAQMGSTLEEYWIALDIATPVSLVPLEDVMQPDGFIRAAFSVDGENDAPVRIAEEEVRIALRRCIQALPERERQVLLLYYGRDMNLAEIGEVFAVSPSRICQVLTVSRGKLRSALLAALEQDSVQAAG